jgi:TRAP transporter TAXI family solute receptor
MSPRLRSALQSFREFGLGAGPIALLAAGLLFAAYLVLRPNPARVVVMATGPVGGAYEAFGERYVRALARHGIRLELRNTQGSAENLSLLRDAGSAVELAFVQGGVDATAAAPHAASGQDDAGLPLVSLGSLFHEPLWLFYREDSAKRLLRRPALSALSELKGWRLNVGAAGSGTPYLVQQLLQANRLDTADVDILQSDLTSAVVGLVHDRNLDALVLLSAPEASMVQMLLHTPGIRLFHFDRAEAYARQFPFLSAVTLPRGVVDLAGDEPPSDVHLVAPTASLVAREGVHPALVQLLVQAAWQIHGDAGWFQRKGDFPRGVDAERRMDDEAVRIYRDGPPWLQRYVPFWLANLADRMWLATLAILAVLIPLSRIVPPLLEFRIRSRIFRWYGRLRAIEREIGQRDGRALLLELDDMDGRARETVVPLSHADELYALRSHIVLVRKKLLAAEIPKASG